MAAKQTAAAKAAPTGTAASDSPTKIHIQAEAAKKVKFRQGTARAEWWQRMQDFNGKPLADFVKDVQAKPPSMPTKGKLADKLEPVKGWINFFQREGLVKLG